jgi:hypothetical protein
MACLDLTNVHIYISIYTYTWPAHELIPCTCVCVYVRWAVGVDLFNALLKDIEINALSDGIARIREAGVQNLRVRPSVCLCMVVYMFVHVYVYGGILVLPCVCI